jgi:hypothetical protein
MSYTRPQVESNQGLRNTLLSDPEQIPNLEWHKVLFERHFRVLKNGCWEWTGAKMVNRRYPKHVYGRFRYLPAPSRLRRSISAHRFSFLAYKGAIPLGYDVDHLCQYKLCVNPHHLEAVPHKVNCERIPAHLRERTSCAKKISLAKIEWWAQRRAK